MNSKPIKEFQTEDKSKYLLTVDFIMIIGKYFKTNNDFVNVMKVCKKFQELVSMYKFNPISDISLFECMQTQHFYSESDFATALPKMYQYIFWTKRCDEGIEYIRRANHRANYRLNEYDKNDLNSRIICKDATKMLIDRALFNTPFEIGKVWNRALNVPVLHYMENTSGDMLVVICYYRITKLPMCKLLYRSVNNEYDSFDDEFFHFETTSGIFKIVDNRDGYLVASIDYRSNPKKLELKTNLEKEILLKRLFCGNKSFRNFTKLNNNIPLKQYDCYTLIDRTQHDANFHERYYTNLLGRHLNVLLDSYTFVEDSKSMYNLGYVRYIYIDKNGNHIIFNVLPSEIIITVRFGNIIRVYKPETKMTAIINNEDLLNQCIWNRFRVNKWLLNQFYEVTLNDMISPADKFIPVRMLIASNEYTRYSCVFKRRYIAIVRNNELLKL